MTSPFLCLAIHATPPTRSMVLRPRRHLTAPRGSPSSCPCCFSWPWEQAKEEIAPLTCSWDMYGHVHTWNPGTSYFPTWNELGVLGGGSWAGAADLEGPEGAHGPHVAWMVSGLLVQPSPAFRPLEDPALPVFGLRVSCLKQEEADQVRNGAGRSCQTWCVFFYTP